MLKRLAILAVISAPMAVYVLGQPNKISGDKDKTPGNIYQPLYRLTPTTITPIPSKHPSKSTDEAFSLHTAIKRPEWWAIGIALGTLILISWQSKATADAAKAALLQANHIVTSERAWMVAEAGGCCDTP